MTTNQLSALHVVGAVTIALATPGDLHAILDLVDAVVFPKPQTHLFVQKDIQASVRDGDNSSVAIMSFVDQTYSQGNTTGGAGNGTPEPASLGVLALGGLAILARRRK